MGVIKMSIRYLVCLTHYNEGLATSTPIDCQINRKSYGYINFYTRIERMYTLLECIPEINVQNVKKKNVLY